MFGPLPSTLLYGALPSTKYVRRYHSPSIKRMIQERAQHIETLEAQSDAAFIAFLAEIADVHYGALRDAIQKLATADCLLALAQLSLQPGYVKPEFSDEDIFQVIGGRHPMLEQLRSDPYVPNDMTMGGDEPRSKVITGERPTSACGGIHLTTCAGPNMGGKSSCVRMLALCAIMAQIGAYVPADSCRLRLLDGIMTRMGGKIYI
jgi:DNA mismatch repair protein MSH3